MSTIFKALLKKQLRELVSGFNSKNGRKGPKSGNRSLAIYLILLLFGFVSFGMIFSMTASSLFDALHGIGADWLYFALMSLMGMMLSVIGSAFMTYAMIYKAKDNEMLLSMPIPQGMILLARMCGCYIMALVFGALPLIPALIIWCVNGMASVLSVLLSVLTIFILPLVSLAISCLLGWIIALIAPHVRHKSLVTTILSIIFLGAYFVFYTNANSILQSLIQHSSEADSIIRNWMFPIYMLGRGMTGEVVPYLLFVVCAAVIFGIVYLAMARSFISLATASEKTKKAVYHEKTVKRASHKAALLRRELLHYRSSATYIMNCTMGSMFMIVLSVFAIIKAGTLREVISGISEGFPGITSILPLLAGAAVTMLISYNLMTVPSVSLEGKTLWLVKALPLTTREIIDSKMMLHLLLTLPFSVITHIIICAAVKADLAVSAAALLFVLVYNFASASLGMVLAIKMPNLNYTDEAAAIKQNWGVMIIMFGGMLAVGLLAFLYYLVHTFIAPWLFALIASALFAAVTALTMKWIYTRGARIFEEL